MTAAFPKRGEVYWVKLDPAIGSETKKTRPALIVSNDIGNEVSTRVIVAPLTSQVEKIYPFETAVKMGSIRNKVMLDQTRVIDKRRLGNRITQLTDLEMAQVNHALKLVLGLD
ncbi:MAG: type II toxin-antitoxin system PemK/MazF family toxin [Candidatus Omnitrophica bacterium]|nr:type II toxin-antitoxin system PemK/MazF family toxin [Candidatus Omnitrophota bacterium]